MPYFGCHLSIAGGYRKMGRDAVSIGADTCQFFTRNPRGGSAKAISREDVDAFKELMLENSFGPLVTHGAYTLNPCSSKSEVREFALMAMTEDLARLDEYLPNNLYNFHPGSHVGQGIPPAVSMIVDTLNKILPDVKHTTVLLETMSGKGSEVGSRFEELAEIIARVNCPDKLGVCLDTCHVYSAGYDIVNDLDGVLEEFDRIIGIKRLYALHINDSMTPFASHKDRHEKLGLGSIGREAFVRIAAHPAFAHLPMCLETPHDKLSGWKDEIAFLKAAYCSSSCGKTDSSYL